ncbi:hypothetical protein [Streptomyces sp. NPDC048172]|uniref:hypothetical protein n=1 Tax=Streptomyces sp. NPDC048172 TaxID=3365505 RepID=UPI00371E7EF2
MSGVVFSGATVQAAPAGQTQARAGGAPFPYSDCIKEAKRQGKKDAVSRCDNLVAKGWVKKPGT